MPAASPDPHLVASLVSAAVRFISIRNRSTHEVDVYLTKKTANNPELIQAVMQRLSHFNLLNDPQFAREWVGMRLKHGKGPLLINQELKQKGLDPDLINQCLAEIEREAWLESATQLINQKHLPVGPNVDLKSKAKVYRYLQNRGYPSSIIRSVIDDKGSD